MVAAKSPKEDENSSILLLVGGTQVVAGSNLDGAISMIQTLRLIVRFLTTTKGGNFLLKLSQYINVAAAADSHRGG